MKQKRFLSAAIALLFIVICTTSWVSPKHNLPPGKIAIFADFSSNTFPSFSGFFHTTGALIISGTVTMNVTVIANSTRLRCLMVFTKYETDGTGGTFTAQLECSPPDGRWQIVSGTGAYTHLRGNGVLTMPPGSEAMTGVIY